MQIIFGYVSNWHIPILKLLKYLKFKVYYLYIDSNIGKKDKIASVLKNIEIYPLPIELEKEILSEAGFATFWIDPEEFTYKKNQELVPDSTLKKYSLFFSKDGKYEKKIRLLIQDFIYSRQLSVSSKLYTWSALYPNEKIIYVSFKFRCFYMSDTSKNIYKIIIPFDLINYFIRVIKIKKIFSFLKKIKNLTISSQKSNKGIFKKFSQNRVAYITHKGLLYGSSKDNKLFEKSLYYSNDQKSHLNKKNLLHMDYDNVISAEENLNWLSLNKIKVSETKIFFKTLLTSFRTFYYIKSWPTFLGWLLFIQKYSVFLKYFEIIKNFKNLKIAVIDYDVLCPKTLLLALEKNNIRTVATQERFMHIFCKSYANVIVDTYYVTSNFAANFLKSSKYSDIKNLIPVGIHRSDYLSLYQNSDIPKEIYKAKNEKKKILVVLGYNSPLNWFESYTSLHLNWTSQITFLEDIVKLSKNLNNTFIVVRYKSLNWTHNEYFKKIIDKINSCENVIISSNYKESFYSYKLCANADLVIAKHTSLADECLSIGIPVLFYDYTHNMKQIISGAFDYSPSRLMCNNFDDLLAKSISLLFKNESELKDDISELNKKIYNVDKVDKKENIKNKIIGNLENLINSI